MSAHFLSLLISQLLAILLYLIPIFTTKYAIELIYVRLIDLINIHEAIRGIQWQ